MKRLAIMLLLLAGCERQPPPPAAEANAAEAPAPAAVVTPAAGCADGWAIEIDRETFANNGADKKFPEARLAAFRQELEKGVRGAVGAACREGALDPAKAKAVTRLLVRSASGADDPVFFEMEQPKSIELEWVFAENDLTIPSEMELRGGLVCWSDPESELCAERGP